MTIAASRDLKCVFNMESHHLSAFSWFEVVNMALMQDAVNCAKTEIFSKRPSSAGLGFSALSRNLEIRKSMVL